MKVKIKLYGMLATKSKVSEFEVTLSECMNVRELVLNILKTLGIKGIKLEELEDHVLILINGKPPKPEVEICGNEEIALLPPAVGG